MDDDCRAVYGQLGSRARHPDELAERLSLPLPRLQRALLELVLSGLARENGNGAYQAT
jgi:predicted Rossmann fold nucleotide-binding protein DprA/Smf involved in DNA uptake